MRIWRMSLWRMKSAIISWAGSNIFQYPPYLFLRFSLYGWKIWQIKLLGFTNSDMGRVKRIWYLSPMRAAKVQARLLICAALPEPSLLAHTSSEPRGTFSKRNLQTENQIPGPSEWLDMRSWNLSCRIARRHKFAWRGSYVKVIKGWLLLSLFGFYGPG